MTMGTAGPAQASRSGLKPGQVVGGRFRVEGAASEDALGSVLAARDDKTGKPISLRVLPRGLLADAESQKVLRAEVKNAALLGHKSVVATYGVGNDPSGASFIACEWVDGTPLSSLVAHRRAAGRQLSLKGAYNVIAHVCKALAFAHGKQMTHGALRPSVVWISRSGRVKVGDFGVGRAVVTRAGAAALGNDEQACLAPEVKQGQSATARSDIFGVGALLYAMLTGRSPAEAFVPPSQAHPDATPDIDQVLMRCLAMDPAARYGSPDEVREALLPLVAHAPEATAEDFGIDVDVDMDLASQRPAAPAQPMPAPVIPRTSPVPGPRPSGPGAGDRPRVGERVSLHEGFRASGAGGGIPGMAGTPVAAAPAGAKAQEASSQMVDLGSVLAKITENDAPRWMVVKDNLDHGPFSGRELVQMIVKGEVLADHGLLNMDTGERRKVKGFTEFTEFLEQYKLKRAAEEHQKALVRSSKVETASNAVKIFIGIGVLVLLGGAVAIYFLGIKPAQDEAARESELADLYERGNIEITGTAGILPDPPRRGGGGGRRGGGGRSGPGGMSYDEAMNQAVNMGDATQGGSERRLTPADVAGVMNRRLNSLFSCVSAELRRGGSLGRVTIDLAISGDGSVQGASVRPGSGEFQSCIAGRVRAIRFPSFPAPRMGARYSFEVD